MAITFFDRASTPADAGSMDDTSPVAITPPASMVLGDLVVVTVEYRNGSAVISQTTTGGQGWTENTNYQTTTNTMRRYWCRYNGTWAANPAWQTDIPGTAGMTAAMRVFRPSSGANTWDVDVAESRSTYTAPGGSFDVTATGQTAVAASTVTIADFGSVDDNTWGIQTGGWSNPGGIAQVRNLVGNDQSLSTAYKIQTSAGATGNVTNRQLTNGGDAGQWIIETYKEVSAAVGGIAYFGTGSQPADNGSLNDGSAVTVTPPASMVSGDLVRVTVQVRSQSAEISIFETGGQSWTANTERETTSVSVRNYWCRFTGTWSANPSFGTDTATGVAIIAQMLVFRPTAGANTWAVDVSEQFTAFAAPGGSFDVTATGQTAIATSTVTIASFSTADDNVWAIQTGGWSNPGGVTQVRNLVGNDASQSIAYLIQTAAGATGNVTNRQTAQGGDAGVWTIETFKEISVAGTIPAFTSTPVAVSTTATSITDQATPSTSCTWHAIAVKVGATAPTAAQVIAGVDYGGVTVHTHNSAAITGTDSLVIGGSLTKPGYDIYHALTNAYDSSAVFAQLSALLAPPSGLQYMACDTTAGIGAESLWFGASPAIATGDIQIAPAETPEGGEVITLTANGMLNIVMPAGALSRRTCPRRFWDISTDGYSDTAPVLFYINNVPPLANDFILDYQVNAAITPHDLRDHAQDFEGQEITVTAQTAEPTGLNSTGTPNFLTGTPTVSAQTIVTYRYFDETGIDYDDADIVINVGNFLIPDVVGLDIIPGTQQILASGFDVLTEGVASGSVPLNQIYDQDPNAGTSALAGSVVTLFYSLGSTEDDGLQELLDPNDTGKGIRIVRRVDHQATNTTSYYVFPNTTYAGRARWVDVDSTGTDLEKYTEIIAALEYPALVTLPAHPGQFP